MSINVLQFSQFSPTISATNSISYLISPCIWAAKNAAVLPLPVWAVTMTSLPWTAKTANITGGLNVFEAPWQIVKHCTHWGSDHHLFFLKLKLLETTRQTICSTAESQISTMTKPILESDWSLIAWLPCKGHCQKKTNFDPLEPKASTKKETAAGGPRPSSTAGMLYFCTGVGML